MAPMAEGARSGSPTQRTKGPQPHNYPRPASPQRPHPFLRWGLLAVALALLVLGTTSASLQFLTETVYRDFCLTPGGAVTAYFVPPILETCQGAQELVAGSGEAYANAGATVVAGAFLLLVGLSVPGKPRVPPRRGPADQAG